MNNLDLYYDTLKLSPYATAEEIVVARDRLLGEYHPDRVPSDLIRLRKIAQIKTDEVNAAYNILIDHLSKESKKREAAAKEKPAKKNGKNIDWDDFFENIQEDIPEPESNLVEYQDTPQDILRAWITIEVLSPQTYKIPKDLLTANESIKYVKDGEPWFINKNPKPEHRFYYTVYLGAINLDRATNKLTALFEKKQQIELLEIKGEVALGTILLDENGIPILENGICLSSFGWGYGQAFHNIGKLKHWESAEEILLSKINPYIYQQDDDGNELPLSFKDIEKIYEYLVVNCRIPKDDLIPPYFVVQTQQRISQGSPDSPLLNSFYLPALQNAMKSRLNKPTSLYLEKSKPKEKFDILKDKEHLTEILQPQNTPLGRWPGKGRYPLSLLQQTAVNFIYSEMNGKETKLLSVNGPPGTGKTTLLRDVIAFNIVERAIQLSKFANPQNAFKKYPPPYKQVPKQEDKIEVYTLSEKIRGYEMLVASTNNKAVENISKELPLVTQIADEFADLNYFSCISSALLGANNATWGNIAAALGNSKNRNDFTDKAWWDENTGLMVYLNEIIRFKIKKRTDEKIPFIISASNPPKGMTEALSRWKKARKKFAVILGKSKKIRKVAQTAFEFFQLKEKVRILEGEIEEQKARIKTYKKICKQKEETAHSAEFNSSFIVSSLEEHEKNKPASFCNILRRKKWKQWQKKREQLIINLDVTERECITTKAQFEHAQKIYQESLSLLDNLFAEKRKYEKEIREVEKYEVYFRDKTITPGFWNRSYEAQQLFAPNYTDEGQYIRDELFVAAIELHKAFIDAAARKIKANLLQFFLLIIKGKPLGKTGFYTPVIPHLWSTFFLFTPVVSTTFASIERMLRRMYRNSIGWLLIDEAGQAVPQAAIGAIFRARKVVAVGDPLQIQPVVTLPPPILESIGNHFKVNPDKWLAPEASVQTLADNANPYGTIIERDVGDIRIGTPLLVHRRCENPMFKICNKLAYNNKMVQATVTSKEHNPYTEVFGQCKWYDIKGSSRGKWSPEEGEFVVKMLQKILTFDKVDVFVISPYRIVAQQMQRRMETETIFLEKHGVKYPLAWIRKNIGTIHTFQGREAQSVILLLGAANQDQSGARAWAAENVNLLNVAISRAKRNLYIIGNHDLWSKMGKMQIIAAEIPSKNIPLECLNEGRRHPSLPKRRGSQAR